MTITWNGTEPVDTVVVNGDLDCNVIVNSAKIVHEAATHPFVATWRTTTANETLTIPFRNSSTAPYNAVIDWGDGSPNSTITAFDDPDRIHTYTTAGDHVVKISGVFPGLYYLNGDVAKLIKVHSMGKVGNTFISNAFRTATNLNYFRPAVCDTSAVTSFYGLFFDCDYPNLLLDLRTMDLSGATNLRYMFRSTHAIQILISETPTTSLTECDRMYESCFYTFSLNLGGLDTTNCASFQNMFRYMGYYPSTKPNLSQVADFNISSLTNATEMFFGVKIPTDVYDQILINWQAQPHNTGVTAHFGTSQYTAGTAAQTARDALVADGWTITDGGGI